MEVVFIPGFMQPAEAWQDVAALLPERYPSVLLSHREHTYEGRLAEIAAAGEGRVLCGYSLGGRLALRAAVADPPPLRRPRHRRRLGRDRRRRATRAARAEADAKLAGWMETQPIEDDRRRMGAPAAVRRPVRTRSSRLQRPGRLAQDPARPRADPPHRGPGSARSGLGRCSAGSTSLSSPSRACATTPTSAAARRIDGRSGDGTRPGDRARRTRRAPAAPRGRSAPR